MGGLLANVAVSKSGRPYNKSPTIWALKDGSLIVGNSHLVQTRSSARLTFRPCTSNPAALKSST